MIETPDINLPSRKWDKREKKDLKMLYSIAEDCITGLSFVFDSGLVNFIKSKLPNDHSLKGRNYALYGLSIAFRDYAQFWDGKRKTREHSKDEVMKFLAYYKLNKDPKILRATESTYDLIDKKMRVGK